MVEKIRSSYIFIFLLLTIVALFVFTNSAQADSVSQTYNSPTQLVEGSLVSLTTNSQSQVELSNAGNLDRLLGIVVAAQNSLVNLDTSNGNTQVVVNGQTGVLVSDINGEVKNGDPLTASPLSGVAMKATSQSKIVGLAQADFIIATQKRPQTVRDKDGKTNTFTIGLLPVNISVTQYVSPVSLEGNSFVSGIQAVAMSTTGKPVSAVRAFVALLVLLIAVGVSIVMLYTSLSSSIRSIGRNPLSKHAILLGLIQIIIAVVAIMLSGFAIMFLILTR
ncbi:hypothetical protein H0W80_01175 [Candidatus Saccharibacteria bacterium]|nr:hypothetical protein [Candidatus Saccharibacteria bacterium]